MGTFKLLLDYRMDIKSLDEAAYHLLGDLVGRPLTDALSTVSTEDKEGRLQARMLPHLSRGHSISHVLRLKTVWGEMQVQVLFVPHLLQRRLCEILVLGYRDPLQQQPMRLTQRVKAPLNPMGRKREGLLDRLEEALRREEFYLDYQPQIDLKNGQVTGVEAFVRWRDRSGLVLTAADFMVAAEQSGMIHPIGDWVMRTAFRHFKTLVDRGTAPSRLSINLSAGQLLSEDFISRVKQILKESCLDSSYVNFEITESITIYSERVLQILYALKELGTGMALDNFGTGYSSINYIQRLPIDLVKIDKSLLVNLEQDRKHQSMVKSIIAAANELEVSVVAKGVECREQLDFLTGTACKEAQGFYFSKPSSLEELERNYL
ncbi:EAL domain-containing protein [Paenibacillus sp. CAA11]|uniref:EAL domain-containing protein n=1 Tax=Paenibacillus sp. CAA11 TaxID=1532905 RepID=UPI00131F39FA|nr:EAL domain-containing protein [Paenibacillus sp. CAA11]